MNNRRISEEFVSGLIKNARHSYNEFKYNLNQSGLYDLTETDLQEVTSYVDQEIKRLYAGNIKENIKLNSFATYLMQYRSIESGKMLFTKGELRQITHDFVEYLNKRRF